MTKTELLTERDKRGDEYAAAVDAFKTAFIRLAAIDGALSNAHVGHGDVVRGFGVFPDPIKMQHPIYAPNVPGDWASEIAAERDGLIAEFTAE